LQSAENDGLAGNKPGNFISLVQKSLKEAWLLRKGAAPDQTDVDIRSLRECLFDQHQD
jgi:hypothetical protein